MMPKYRGELRIHASKTQVSAQDWDECCEEIKRLSGIDVPPRSEMKFGGVIGTVTLADTASEYEGEAFDSGWWQGPCGLLLEDPKPLDFVPCKGALGLFETPCEPLA